ncbi:MAG: bifunctional oligoribonuclease/PAP phosphatase NrnA [Clostridia bacterium]|nr:bifunctional oligoribonuclease/PAP phosphatase NrnA [Clostridia bacterium]
MNVTIEEIISKLKSAKTVAIFCHVRPDGDALGSGLALCLALNNLGKTAYMCCEDLPPEKFNFLSATGLVKSEIPELEYDTLISVDCADEARLGVFCKRFQKFKKTTINIDHHISNSGFAKYNYVINCPATCEIMTGIFQKAGFEITKDIADLLMLGLITDSGNFTHCDVTEKTFQTAAHLRACGADVNKINYEMFSRQSKARAKLFGRVMNNIRFDLDDKFAYIVISMADMQEFGADKSLTEGFVDFPLTIDGVEVAAALLEYKKEQYKASLRSKGTVNVNSVASAFGGGGHILASGCMLFGTLEHVLDKLTYAVYQNL